jgi:hypothetical protein
LVFIQLSGAPLDGFLSNCRTAQQGHIEVSSAIYSRVKAITVHLKSV